MEQVRCPGQIGKKAGDIGFELAFVVTVLVYPVTRVIGLKVRGLWFVPRSDRTRTREFLYKVRAVV
jgi:hypothetical protein